MDIIGGNKVRIYKMVVGNIKFRSIMVCIKQNNNELVEIILKLNMDLIYCQLY
jgi:hypothetical protein